jgi:hypothetical protein
MNPIPNCELTLTGSYYTGDSNASGQIPLRAVEQGIIDNFGSIDPSEGGNTQRTMGRVRFRWDARPGGTAFANIYAQYYQLDLFSNFTFFLTFGIAVRTASSSPRAKPATTSSPGKPT